MVDSDPEDRLSLEVFGKSIFRTGNYQRCAEALERALAWGGPTADVLLYQAMTYWHLGRLDEAQNVYARCLAGLYASESQDFEIRSLLDEAKTMFGVAAKGDAAASEQAGN